MTTETAPPAAADERVRRVSTLTRLLTRPEFGAILATVVVWLFFALVAWDNNFVSWGTTAAIVNRAAPLGLLAIAVSMLMIGGEFDLSVGSLLGWSGMVIMILVTPTAGGGWGWSLWPAVAVAIVLALIAGFLNGLLVLTTKLPSFIITLGSLFIFRGLAVAIPRLTTNRTQLGGLDQVSWLRLRRYAVRHAGDVVRLSVRHSDRLVDRAHGARHVGSAPHPVWQLDVRRGRRRKRRT